MIEEFAPKPPGSGAHQVNQEFEWQNQDADIFQLQNDDVASWSISPLNYLYFGAK